MYHQPCVLKSFPQPLEDDVKEFYHSIDEPWFCPYHFCSFCSRLDAKVCNGAVNTRLLPSMLIAYAYTEGVKLKG